MSRLTMIFPANRRGFRPAGGGALGVVLKPEREHAAESEPVRETCDFSTPMRTVDHRSAGGRP